ncbi:MAG: hypothetical protein N2039_10245 [Gemmataceae bacterium]|nr:hypothetical protein [Gemmataceae bacterium]
MEIKWTDHDPESGERRFLRAVRFAGFWKFQYRSTRRGVWTRLHPPTLEMWETVLDALQRRYRRREGVSEEDIQQVERIIRELRSRLAPEEE